MDITCAEEKIVDGRKKEREKENRNERGEPHVSSRGVPSDQSLGAVGAVGRQIDFSR
jgi:hypothetical protein